MWYHKSTHVPEPKGEGNGHFVDRHIDAYIDVTISYDPIR